MLPLSWEERLHAMSPPIYTHDSYWQMSEASRRALQEQARAIPPAFGAVPGTAPAMYEAQQAPLYYWMMAVPLRLASEWSLAARVLLIRVLGVLLASLVVPIAYGAASCFTGSPTQALGVVAVIVCMPELMIDVSRAGNESLAIVVYSGLTLLLLIGIRPGHAKLFIAGGFLLGVGLLTKAYFVLAVPAFVLVAIYSLLRLPAERIRILLSAVAGIGLAALISVGWYWRNHVLTGSWSGEENDVTAAHLSRAHLLSASGHVNWTGGITSVLVSHIWFGGWSFLKLPKPVYLVFALGMAAALLGLIKLVFKDRLRSGQLFVVLALYVCFWIGLLYDIFVVYIATGVSASDGWYMYAVVVPEVLLVCCGLYSIVPARWHRAILPGLASVFAVIDFYGVTALLVPYYTGVIAHVSGSDVVRPVRLMQLLTASPRLLLERLAANRPAALGPTVLGMLFAVYCLSTVATVVVSYATEAAVAPNADFRPQP